jgi:hypothetical protein
MSRSHHTRRLSPLLVGGVVVLAIGLLAPAASASTGATATVTSALQLGGKDNAGTDSSYTYTLTPASGQIRSFNLTAPSGWKFTAITSSPTTGTLALASGNTVIQGRGLSITTSGFQMTFTALAPCADTASAWRTVAKTGAGFTGSSFSVPDVSASLTGHCSAVFTRSPANAAFNDPPNFNGPSENITSVPYTPDTTTNPANAIQVAVTDATGKPRDGIAITLSLSTNPTGATLGGGSSLTAASTGGGLATFPGSPNDITIDTIGQGYKMTPTGSGVVGTESGEFGIYQEGEACGTGSCHASGRAVNSLGHVLTADVSAPSGVTLGAFVSTAVDVLCAGYTSPFSDPPSVVWQYSGSAAQTIVIDISKGMMREILDRGSDHLEFCYDSEGKPFLDKFGQWHWDDPTTPVLGDGIQANGLLPDCNMSLNGTNCIVSETALSGGGREVTVTVDDGKGRI